ncbi:MAG TPA: AfsR/SARP family transcriptional regulator [Stackebrandtia sp.]|jgi:DNA-binding SARP family transcriptional activator|uniref:AfsR/SARP family transcriptional regulator n=1 Tax=Stackebrandtia sp. TaxID=2023065 RepID=UPI002D522268|nr:AfsR/SARP family transcriptional regulator [Stackebrandtia sp.]HZE41332.1 AfsR/SARP family transcriptional regulator [Stackebrandtia sp.]
MPEFEFGLLGALTVRVNGHDAPVGGLKPRRMLATFLLTPGEQLPLDRFIDVVWGAQPPKSASANLYSYVTVLRRALHGRLNRLRSGYVLHVKGGELDVQVFSDLLAQARHDAASGHTAEAIAVYDRALKLWRGEPLADIKGPPPWIPYIQKLIDTRLDALEERAALYVHNGQHSEAIAELRGLIAEHPLRESLWRQLMTALASAGQRAEAIDTYGRLRATLADELGIEPSDESQHVHRKLLGAPTARTRHTDVRTAELRRRCTEIEIQVRAAAATLPASAMAMTSPGQLDYDQPAPTDPLVWLDGKSEDIMALLRQAATAGLASSAWRLSAALMPYLDFRHKLEDWRRCNRIALVAARKCGDTEGEATMLRGLGQWHIYNDNFDAAEESFNVARVLTRALGNERETALAVYGLGAVARFTGRTAEAASLFRDSATALHRIGDAHGEGLARWALAGAFIALENFDGADEQLHIALKAARSVGDRHREAHVIERFATLHRARGNEPEAIACLEDALSTFTDLGDEPCTKEVREALEV